MINAYRQTQLVVWTNQILFFGALIFYFEYWMIPLFIVSNYVFAFMSEASLHRYYTHKSFEVNDDKKPFLRIFALLTGQGATLSWVTVHRTHHAFEDTERDPHSPFHNQWWKLYLALFPNKYKNNLVIDLLKTKDKDYLLFENKWYFYMWILVWTISYSISFYLFFFIVSGAAVFYISTTLINVLSHKGFGVKKYSDAVAYNSVILNAIVGAGNHNTHHKYPKNYMFSEKDVYGLMIRKFLMKL